MNAAREVLKHAERYLDGHLAREQREEALAELSIDDLRLAVQQAEDEYAAAAMDITPEAPPGAPRDIKPAVKDAMS